VNVEVVRHDWAVRLADALRRAGVPVSTGQVIACQKGLATLPPDVASDVAPADATASASNVASGATRGRSEDRYWVGRTCLVSDPAHLEVFDAVYRALSEPSAEPEGSGDAEEGGTDSATDAGPAPSSAGRDVEVARAGAVASDRERLRHRRFDAMDAAERAAIDRLLDRLEVAMPRRRSRRTSPGRRGDLDLPRTLDRSLQTDGELLDRAWRSPRTRPRRLVLVLDVSGSMAAHARALLRFAVAARRSADREVARRVEVFAFGTRLTRLSDALARRDPDAAIAAAASRVVDWDGGTRIGASIDELVRTWAPRGVLRGAVVVICSDGLERGDPAELSAAMGRLRRHAHRILWVNPLAGDERFVPTQRGMAAALPHVDILLPGDTIASLERLADALGHEGMLVGRASRGGV
jgi:uncharacterized protein